jgi:hypothetical protein
MRGLAAFGVGIFAGCTMCWLAGDVVVAQPWLAPLPFIVMVGVCVVGALLLRRR